MVARGDRPPGTRELRARARRRSRVGEAHVCAPRSVGRAGRDGRAPGAVQRMGRPRERLSPRRLRPRAHPAPDRAPTASARGLNRYGALSVELIVLDDERAAAERAGELLAEAARTGGHIALSGGKSPELAHKTAAMAEPEWSTAELWWGDERCVPPDDHNSNYGMAK